MVALSTRSRHRLPSVLQVPTFTRGRAAVGGVYNLLEAFLTYFTLSSEPNMAPFCSKIAQTVAHLLILRLTFYILYHSNTLYFFSFLPEVKAEARARRGGRAATPRPHAEKGSRGPRAEEALVWEMRKKTAFSF